RLAECDWSQMTDDEGPFSASPDSLVRWAPVVQEFKALDADIVRNSVRFRWQAIRRDLRANLDPAGVMAGAVEARIFRGLSGARALPAQAEGHPWARKARGVVSAPAPRHNLRRVRLQRVN